MENIPDTFIEMSADLKKEDDNLVVVNDSLTVIADLVPLIPDSLNQYQNMIIESKKSTDNLKSMLTGFQINLDDIILIATIALVLVVLWLFAFEVVIISQGWEIYHGSANGMAFSNRSLTK